MAEKAVRKTTPKKAVRRTTTKKAPAKTTATKTAVVSTRKAPVVRTASTTQKARGAGGRTFLVGMILFLILMGVSAAIGFSDKGQLDVEGTITLRKQNATPEEQQALSNVPTQQQQNTVPNGGLVGVGKPPKPVVEETMASSTDETASSTDATASTTDDSSQEEESLQEVGEEEPQVAGDAVTEETAQ